MAGHLNKEMIRDNLSASTVVKLLFTHVLLLHLIIIARSQGRVDHAEKC
jgi:hypothetical protein